MKTEYKIIKGGHEAMFQRHVERMISEGWELQGGVSVSFNQWGCELHYYQAITKGTEDDDTKQDSND